MRRPIAAIIAFCAVAAVAVARAGENETSGLRGTAVEPSGAAAGWLGWLAASEVDAEVLRGTVAPAAAADPVDGLRGAVEASLSSSDALRASMSDVKAADYGIMRELASFTPTITANVSQSFEDGLSPLDDDDSRYAGISLNMALFTSGRRLHEVRSARSIARAAGFRALSVRDDVTLSTVEAYLQQVYATAALHVVQQRCAALRRLVASIRAQHASGFASGADIAEASAELKATEQQLSEFETIQAKAETKVLSLASSTVLFRQSFPELEQALGVGREHLLATALQRNPNIMAAAYAAKASEEKSRATFAKHLPQLTLSADYKHILDEVTDGGDRDRWNVGVRLSVPLVDLSTVSSIGESRERAAADRYRARDARRIVAEQMQQLWEDYDSAAERERLAVQQQSYLRTFTKASDARYRKGLTELKTLLDAQRQLLDVDIQIAQLRVQKSLSAVQILVTAGTFEPSMLDL